MELELDGGPADGIESATSLRAEANSAPELVAGGRVLERPSASRASEASKPSGKKGRPIRADALRNEEVVLETVLDQLGAIEAAVGAIAGRLDYDKIVVAGHSWGAQTCSMLLGATHPDPDNGTIVDTKDTRVKVGVLLTVPGTGGDNLGEFAAKDFPFMNPDFTAMETPTLIVAGDYDRGAMTGHGPDWWRETYDLSPSAQGPPHSIRWTALGRRDPELRSKGDH